MQNVILYCRQSVSDGDDEGERENTLSLQSQRATLERWAAEQGWHVVAVITDADQKGWNDQRPGFLELLRRCREGGVSHVAVWSLDRLARSVRLQENCLHELASLGVDVVSYKEPWVSQPLFRQIIGAIAEEQTRTISAHVRRALAERSRQGLPHATAPWGYVRSPESGRLILDPDHPARVDVLRELFARRADGWPLATLAKDLTARAIPSPTGLSWWHDKTIGLMMRNPAYRGAVRASGHVIERAHPAMIDADLWQRAQRPAADRDRVPRSKAGASWCEAHIRHDCGQPMYLVQSGADRAAQFRCRHVSYGHLADDLAPCQVMPRRMVAHRIESVAWDAITATLDALLPAHRVIGTLRSAYRRAASSSDGRRREMENQVDRLGERRAKAEELFLSGMRDRAWLHAQDAQLGINIDTCRVELARLPAPPDVAAIEATWQGLQTVRELAAGITSPKDRARVLAMLGVVVVTAGCGASTGARHGAIRFDLRPDLVPYFRAPQRP